MQYLPEARKGGRDDPRETLFCTRLPVGFAAESFTPIALAGPHTPLPRRASRRLCMHRLRSLGLLSLCLSLCVFAAAQEMHPPARSTPAFDQLKSLAGEWQGTTTQDSKVQLTYQVVSNGSVLMERLQSAGESEMITMYSLDGDHIVVTHYCSAGNQPTMQTPAGTAATGRYDFSFVRVSGTKTPDEGHMVSLSVTIPDKDHLTQVWTFDDHGKSMVETFTYTRKK